MENIMTKQQTAVLIDWQVRVTRDLDITRISPMTRDHTRVRLLPSYLETGQMSIVVPATSKEAAEEKAKNIAREVISSGLWGAEIWNSEGFLASIERFL